MNEGGKVIETVKQDAGCNVRVLEAVPGSNHRVVLVAGLVHRDDRVSAVQDAVLRMQSRISRAGLELNELGAIARLLISSNQIGCLLGKGGSVISEMRKLSGAHIHVLPKDLFPKCASRDEEVVQIDGDFEAVQKGLVEVTTRLQHYFFVEAFHSRNNISPNPAFSDQSPFMASKEASSHGPPFLKSDSFGSRRNDIHHQFGGAAHISDRRHWGPQGLLESHDPGLLEFGVAPQRTTSEFLGRDLPADIPSTTVEVTVPRSVVPAIYGEDGECLKQICEFCDAKITIGESKAEAVETTIFIYGTPEQTHAAQSLIQAFVISEAEFTL